MKDELPIQWWKHVVLFVLAFATSYLAGFAFEGASPWESASWGLIDVHMGAAAYAVATMAILMAHEMGHYVFCRIYGVRATPPYFLPGLPVPGLGIIPFIGTFGAFIRMEVSPMKASELLRIGAWGPIAGFVVALPVLMIGFSLSEVRPLPEDIEATLVFGDSLVLLLGEMLFHPSIPDGHDVFLHPLAMAGWVGCFLTALNLLPVGQLDGGHIAYSVFGKRYNVVVPFLFGALLILGVLQFLGWLVIAVLVWKMGIKHPPVVRGEFESGVSAWPAVACGAIFVLTFAPAPIVGGGLPELLGWW